MPGTDMKINYGIRPAKTIERKLMCELFHHIKAALSEKDYRYIGLGAKYFADFILFHNEFGFDQMISIEAQEDKKDRYEHNKPLKCIEMLYGYTCYVLPQINWKTECKNIVWLDYDQTIERFMLEDTDYLIRNMPAGSMFFISFNSALGPRKASPLDRLEILKQKLAEKFPPETSKRDLAEVNKDSTIKRIIDKEIAESIAKVNLLKEPDDHIMYKQLLYVTYQDGAPMTTVGGILLNKNQHELLSAFNIEDRVPFVVSNIEAAPFNINAPLLTYKEVHCLLEQLPVAIEEIDNIKVPGLDENDIRSFFSIYRYYPHFIQAYISN